MNFIDLSKSKIKLNLSLVGLVLFLVFIALNFQNCSDLGSSNYSGSGSGKGGIKDVDIVDDDDDDDDDDDIGGVLSEPGSVTASFSEGDGFRRDTILVSEDSFLDTMIEELNYFNRRGFKAIAVAKNGLGYMSFNGENAREAERMALESCNLLTNLKCAVIVSQNTFVIDDDDIEDNLEYIIGGLKGEDFNRNEIPLVRNSIRKKKRSRFKPNHQLHQSSQQ